MNNTPQNVFFQMAFGLGYATLCLFALQHPAWGQTEDGPGSRLQRFKQIRETQRANREAIVSDESLGASAENSHVETYGGREILVYVPSFTPAKGQHALLVALHGGGGNAEFFRDHLKINGVAERNGFVVAYLNGSAAARLGGNKLKAWNAGGGCCGKPYRESIDDIGYIAGAVAYLQGKYGVSTERTYGVGHSNGAIMLQTVSCQTDLFSKVASLAGTLMSDAPTCPAARGHTIYNYHGQDDQNVPIAGGYGTKGVTTIKFVSQAEARSLFESAGGRYLLHVFPGADHSIEHLSVASQKESGVTIAERIARDLGLVSGH